MGKKNVTDKKRLSESTEKAPTIPKEKGILSFSVDAALSAQFLSFSLILV
jgi:hypothetical protein